MEPLEYCHTTPTRQIYRTHLRKAAKKNLFLVARPLKRGEVKDVLLRKKDFFGEIVVLTKSVFGCLRLKKEKEKKKKFQWSLSSKGAISGRAIKKLLFFTASQNQ